MQIGIMILGYALSFSDIYTGGGRIRLEISSAAETFKSREMVSNTEYAPVQPLKISGGMTMKQVDALLGERYLDSWFSTGSNMFLARWYPRSGETIWFLLGKDGEYRVRGEWLQGR